MNKIFLDTNILLYSVERSNNVKHLIVGDLLSDNALISTQVVSEFCNVCRNKFKIEKNEVFRIILEIAEYIDITSVTIEVLVKAKYICAKYDFQFFDSIIIASALLSGCSTFYSEDFQHNQIIEGQLKIINPFI